MSDNENDELDPADLGLDDDDDDFGNFDDAAPNTLGAAVQDNPLFKIGAIAVVVVCVFGIIMFFGSGEKAPVNPSILPSGSDVRQPPGTSELSDAMRDEIIVKNEQERERAEQTGETFIPIPLDTPDDTLKVTDEPEPEADPLRRWRELQQQRTSTELASIPAATQSQAPSLGSKDIVQRLADLMGEQMSAILESRTAVQLQTIKITDPSYLEQLQAEEEQAQAEQAAVIAAQQAQAEQPETEVLIGAGEIEYAQLLIEANTDIPGPVLAQIVSGPLRGSRVIGSFTANYDTITLNFDTIVVDGEAISVEGIAVDPDTSLIGMATEVDHRYFQRIILPMAASFVEGAAEAISESGNTTITIQGESVAEETDETSTNQDIASGIDEAGQELSEILDELNDDIETLIRIEAGTPFGLLFLSSVVVDENGSQVTNPQQIQPAAGQGIGNQGQLPGLSGLGSQL